MSLFPAEVFARLFSTPSKSQLHTWVGQAAASTSDSFLDTLKLAFTTFHRSSSIDQSLAIAQSMPQIDYNVIQTNDIGFASDPLGTIESHAHLFSHTRISNILANIHYATAPTDLQRRLNLLIEPQVPIVDPGFKPDIHSALTRPGNLASAPISTALIWKSHLKGEVLLVSRTVYASTVMARKLEASLAHIVLVPKPDDIGRLCYDYKSLPGSFPVNGGDLKPRYISTFGRLNLPTFKDYLDILYDARDSFPSEKIFIAKSDLSRFYHRARWSASGSLLMSVLVDKDLVAIPITHGFGKGEVPYLYSAYSDFCDHCHYQRCQTKNLSHIMGRMYSDDFTTFGSHSFLRQELEEQATQIATDIHPDAVNLDKVELSPIANILGIRTDSHNFICGLSHKSYLKLCYLFFILLPPKITINTMISLKILQSLAGLCYYNGQYIPLCRATGKFFYRALRGYSSRPRSLSQLQIDCITLWRSYILFAFSHSSVLSSTIYDVYHNNPNAFPISKRSVSGSIAYTDSDLHSMGAYIPALGFCQVHLSSLSIANLTIAHYELLALVIAFLLAIQLNPGCAAVHIYIDNKNALAWSAGKIGTNDQSANMLSLMNCFLQVAYKTTQTRSYIASKDNIEADAISRRKFQNSDQLIQFSPNTHLTQFLQQLVNQHDTDVSQILQLLLTLQDYPVSSLFVAC